MDQNEITSVLKELNQDVNGEFLSARKNSSNISTFSPENLKETNNNKFTTNLDKTFEQENFNFTEFEDKTVDNTNNVNVCEISNNIEVKKAEETVSEDKYLARNPVNDTTIAGYSSDEETFAECHSYIIPETKEHLTSASPTNLNETVVQTSSKLSLTNLNFENLKIDDNEDLDKTTTAIVDDYKSGDEEEEEEDEVLRYNSDANDLDDSFRAMPEQNIKPIEFEEFGLPNDDDSPNKTIHEDFEIASDKSLHKVCLDETLPIVENESPTMVKKIHDKDSEIFLENIVQNNLEVEFKVPDAPPPPALSSLSISNTWCPPLLVNHYNEEMVPATEFNFDANAFDIFNKSEQDNIPQREDSLLLRFDPLLNKPVPVVLEQEKVIPVIEVEVKRPPRCSIDGNLLDITLQNDKSVEIVNETSTKEEPEVTSLNSTITEEDSDDKDLNDTLLELQVRSPPAYDTEANEVDDDQKTELDTTICINTELHSKDETMSVQTNDVKTIKEDDPVIEKLNSPQKIKDEYKMAEIEKKLKNQGIKSDDNDRKLKEFESREEALIKRITEKEKVIAKMNSVIEAYETTISEFISEKAQITQQYEKKCVNLQESAQLNASHLLSLEDTFSDLHKKYERSKQMAINFKQNEEKLMAEKKQLNELLTTQETRYEKMKSHAMSQLQVANDKLENLSKNHAQEVSKLKALLKKEEIARTALAEQLQQKIRENEELVKICEELIGGGNVATENS